LIHDDGSLRDLGFSRPWATRAVCWGLAGGVGLIAIFAIVYNPFDFSVYRWGGDAVTHGMRLYSVQVRDDWFTYTPFAATVFIPIAAMPSVLGRLAWELLSLLALAVAASTTLKLAGYRPSWQVIAAVTVAGISLEPMYHTFYLGQINLILMALILVDVWRAARGRPAGLGVGIAAAIKLIPLIFIAMFFLTGRIKAGVISAATFAACGLIGYLVAPSDSRLYWGHLFYDTPRVGGGYISNQSPYGAAVRIAGGTAAVGHWFLVIPLLLGIAGLAIAIVMARNGDWLGAVTVTGVTSLLVSPIAWTHHWVWILPALVILLQGGRWSKIAAVSAYLLFVSAPMWLTPWTPGSAQYGFHWLVTAAANCFLLAGLAFLGYAGWRAYQLQKGNGDQIAAQLPPVAVVRR
jgi:alpha-1,2-mannosyltransferase